jgi:FMN reductase
MRVAEVPAETARLTPYLAVVSGSPAPGSRTLALARHVGARLSRDGADVRYLDVRDLPAEDLLAARPRSAATRSACALVEGAAGLVLVTPVYNAAYSGVLKAFLDLLPQLGLRGKVALPLAVGGTVAHMLVIDYALRPVLASMGTSNVLGGVFLLDSWIHRTDSGDLVIDQQVAERLQQSLCELGQTVHAATSVEAAADLAAPGALPSRAGSFEGGIGGEA